MPGLGVKGKTGSEFRRSRGGSLVGDSDGRSEGGSAVSCAPTNRDACFLRFFVFIVFVLFFAKISPDTPRCLARRHLRTRLALLWQVTCEADLFCIDELHAMQVRHRNRPRFSSPPMGFLASCIPPSRSNTPEKNRGMPRGT